MLSNLMRFSWLARRAGYGCCLLTVLIVMGVTGCTSIVPVGMSVQALDIDPGPQSVLRVCIYKDIKVSDKRAAEIIDAIQKEFSQYGLIIAVPDIREWRRPSFQHAGIMRDIAGRTLEPPFDRNFALVGRDMRDFLWGALLPEILGAVETRTHTKGYAVAEIGSFNQLMTFQSPEQAAVHEFYHMLGVDHGDDTRTIWQKIAQLKRLAEKNRLSGRDFFPGVSAAGKVFLSRHSVDRRFGLVPKPKDQRLSDQANLGIP